MGVDGRAPPEARGFDLFSLSLKTDSAAPIQSMRRIRAVTEGVSSRRGIQVIPPVIQPLIEKPFGADEPKEIFFHPHFP